MNYIKKKQCTNDKGLQILFKSETQKINSYPQLAFQSC